MGDAQASASRPARWQHRSKLCGQWWGVGGGRRAGIRCTDAGDDAGPIHWTGPEEAVLGGPRGRGKSFDFISWLEDIHKR